jgi:hypothetical protein
MKVETFIDQLYPSCSPVLNSVHPVVAGSPPVEGKWHSEQFLEGSHDF